MSGHRTLHSVILAACDLAAQIVPAAVERAIGGRPAPTETPSLPPLAGWPSPADVARFNSHGFRFV